MNPLILGLIYFAVIMFICFIYIFSAPKDGEQK